MQAAPRRDGTWQCPSAEGGPQRDPAVSPGAPTSWGTSASGLEGGSRAPHSTIPEREGAGSYISGALCLLGTVHGTPSAFNPAAQASGTLQPPKKCQDSLLPLTYWFSTKGGLVPQRTRPEHSLETFSLVTREWGVPALVEVRDAVKALYCIERPSTTKNGPPERPPECPGADAEKPALICRKEDAPWAVVMGEG